MGNEVIEIKNGMMEGDELQISHQQMAYSTPDDWGMSGFIATLMDDPDEVGEGGESLHIGVIYGPNDDDVLRTTVTRFPDGSVVLVTPMEDVIPIAGPALYATLEPPA